MKMKYDKDVDVVSINLKKGKIAKTERIDYHTIIDYDKDGSPISIELLWASDFMNKNDISMIPSKALLNK